MSVFIRDAEKRRMTRHELRRKDSTPRHALGMGQREGQMEVRYNHGTLLKAQKYQYSRNASRKTAKSGIAQRHGTPTDSGGLLKRA